MTESGPSGNVAKLPEGGPNSSGGQAARTAGDLGEGVAPSEFTSTSIAALFACFMGGVLGITIVFNATFTNFIFPISADTGWSRSQVSLGLACVNFSMILSLPLVGRVIDRIGPRRVILTSVPVYALMICTMGLIPLNLPIFWGACLLLGIAASGAALNAYLSVLPRLFERRLGIALGICATGTSIGTMLIPMLAQYLIESFGWQRAYMVLGMLTLLVLTPIVMLLPRHRGSNGTLARQTSDFSLGGNDMFWRLALVYSLAGACLSGLFVNIVPLMTDRGFPSSMVMGNIFLFGLSALGARIVVGLVLDRFDAGNIGAVGLLLMAASAAMLANFVGVWPTRLALMLLGVAIGAEGDVLPYVVRKVFALGSYGRAISLLASCFLIGNMVGPLATNLVFDLVGSYRLAFFSLAVFAIFAAILHAPVTKIAAARKSAAA